MKRIIIVMIACMLLSGCEGGSRSKASASEDTVPEDVISQGAVSNSTRQKYVVFKPEGTNRICIMTYRRGYSDSTQVECWKDDSTDISDY